MNLVRRQVRMGRLAAAALGAILVVLLQATGAHAAAPNQIREMFTASLPDETTCSFTIDLTFQVTVVGREYFDKRGNFERATFRNSLVGTDSANGFTLPESDHFVDFIRADDTVKQVGLPVHIKLPNGSVLIRDAGYILIGPDGSITFTHGPHPFLTGDVAQYCAAFGT